MTEKARVIAIDGRRVSVVPLDLEVCLGCSNDQCKSEGSVFTVINRRKFPLSIGSEVRVHARPGRQLLQGVVSVGLPLITGAVSYAALPLLAPIAGSVLQSVIAIGAVILTAALIARMIHVGEAGFPEISAVVVS